MAHKRASGAISTILDRWGNSLGLRLPKGVAEAVGLAEGDRVYLEVENGAVVVRRAKPTYTLEELLDGLTPDMLHGEVDTGEPIGKEDVW
ncbi:MAG TPA: AbrB/MazE/SpoVT family DNA-binding domain-containing protein [Candidatus Baltobacteraceae bacterium]|jgi:antitoxin MazE